MASDVTRILMLHRVQPNDPVAFGLPSSYRMRGTSLTLGELERALDEAGPVLPLDTLERALRNGGALSPGSVLTFDDGYREHLDVVAPWLATRGHSATFYVATGLCGDGESVAAVDAWYWLLDHATRRLGEVRMPDGGVFRAPLDTLEGKRAWVGGPPKAALLSASAQVQKELLDALADSAGCVLPVDLASLLYVRASEWSGFGHQGMRVGAHSVGHPRLTQTDDMQLEREVRDSVAAVARVRSLVAFAYPDGAFDDRVVASVRRAGVSSSVTCEPGDVAAGADLLRLPRRFVATPAA